MPRSVIMAVEEDDKRPGSAIERKKFREFFVFGRGTVSL